MSPDHSTHETPKGFRNVYKNTISILPNYGNSCISSTGVKIEVNNNTLNKTEQWAKLLI